MGLVNWSLPVLALDDPVHGQSSTRETRVDIYVMAPAHPNNSQVGAHVEGELLDQPCCLLLAITPTRQPNSPPPRAGVPSHARCRLACG
jgi:hypothetical protein